MDTTERAITLVRETEAALKALLLEAAKAGDYEALGTMSSMAAELARITASPARTAQGPGTSGARGQASSASGSRGNPEAPALLARGRTRRRQKRRRRGGKAGYPKFFRDRAALVKVGWSARGTKEYRHKASRAEAKGVARAITGAGEGGRLVTTDDFMPIGNPETHNLIPDYRAYVCLAWLRHEGLVVQHGRQGYTVETSIDDRVVDERLDSLDELPRTRS